MLVRPFDAPGMLSMIYGNSFAIKKTCRPMQELSFAKHREPSVNIHLNYSPSILQTSMVMTKISPDLSHPIADPQKKHNCTFHHQQQDFGSGT